MIERVLILNPEEEERLGAVRHLHGWCVLVGIDRDDFDTEALEFLQIWLHPAQTETTPRYQQRLFGDDASLTLVVSPD